MANSNVNVIGTGTLDLAGGISGTHSLSVQGNLTASSIRMSALITGSAGAAAVPEPSILAMLCMVAVGLLLRRR